MSNRSLTEAERAERRQADRRSTGAGRASAAQLRRLAALGAGPLHQRPVALLVRQSASDRHATSGRHLRRGLPGVPGAEPLRPQGRAGDPDPRTDERPRRREARPAKERGRDDGEEPRRTVFRAVSVFDVSQTDALPGTEPVPLDSPSQPIQGDTHAHLLTPLELLAGELGYAVAAPARRWPRGRLV